MDGKQNLIRNIISKTKKEVKQKIKIKSILSINIFFILISIFSSFNNGGWLFKILFLDTPS